MPPATLREILGATFAATCCTIECCRRCNIWQALLLLIIPTVYKLSLLDLQAYLGALLQSHHQNMCQHRPHRSLHQPTPHIYASLFTAICLLSVHLASAAPTTPAPVDSLYFGQYLMPGQLPDMALLPLYQATWRIAGHELDQNNFAVAVRNLTETMFAAYSFHAQLDDLQPSQPALTRLDGQLGRALAFGAFIVPYPLRSS